MWALPFNGLWSFAIIPQRPEPILTVMCGSGFDLDGRAAPAVFLHLRHPLTGHLVGVISGAHRDLVLDDPLTFQLFSAITEKQKQRGYKPQGCKAHSRYHCLKADLIWEPAQALVAERNVTGLTLQPGKPAGSAWLQSADVQNKDHTGQK